MFLIRTGFWLGLVVLLLPTEAAQQRQLQGSATAAVDRMSSFCERNAGTCQTAGRLWQGFVEKAQFGGRLAMDLASTREGDRRATVPPTAVPLRAATAPAGVDGRARPSRQGS